MKTAHAYIYALTEPDSGAVRYVGKANDLKARLRRHLTASALAIKCHRTHWLSSLLSAGKRPVLVLLERVTQEDWKRRECFWISYYRSLGALLVNTAEGGTGGVKPEWISEESKRKMSAAQMGHVRSLESREKQGNSLRGKSRSAETVLKMSITNKGRTPSEQCRLAQIAAATGSKASDATKQKMAEAHKGNQRAKKHDYVATNKDGVEFKVTSLAEFCKEHGLGRAHMSKVASGHKSYRQHKGWTCRFAV